MKYKAFICLQSKFGGQFSLVGNYTQVQTLVEQFSQVHSRTNSALKFAREAALHFLNAGSTKSVYQKPRKASQYNSIASFAQIERKQSVLDPILPHLQ